MSLIELHLEDRVELVSVDPWTDPELRRRNPLAKVPTLVTDAGDVLFESAVICEYLDHLAGGSLFAPPGAARWRALLRQGIGDGVAAAAGRLFADQRRPENQRAESVMKRQAEAIAAGLDRLEEEAEDLSELADIGAIAVACAVAYLGFRWPDRNWLEAHPRLAGWHARVSERPSMRATIYRSPA